MKLNRKVASVLLAVTMFAGVLSVPAMADDGETTGTTTTPTLNKTSNSVTFTKSLTVADDAVTPAAEFTFNVVAKDDSLAATVVDNTKDDNASVTSATTTVGGGASANVTVNFDMTKFSVPGVYDYTLTEVSTGNEDIVVDNTQYTLRLCVVNETNDAGAFTGNFVIEWATLSKMVNGVETKVPGNISNTYNTYSLSLDKVVTGAMGDRSEQFTFDITFTGPVGTKFKNGNTEVELTSDDEEATSGTATVTVKLRDADNAAVVTGIPSTVSYTIVEKIPAGEGYTTSATVKQGTGNATDVTVTSVEATGEGTVDTKTLAQQTMSKNDNVVVVTNNKGAAVSTGLLMDVAPYAAMILLAAAAAFVFLRRRNSNED